MARIFAGIRGCPKPQNVPIGYRFHPLAFRNAVMLNEKAVPGIAIA